MKSPQNLRQSQMMNEAQNIGISPKSNFFGGTNNAKMMQTKTNDQKMRVIQSNKVFQNVVDVYKQTVNSPIGAENLNRASKIFGRNEVKPIASSAGTALRNYSQTQQNWQGNGLHLRDSSPGMCQ